MISDQQSIQRTNEGYISFIGLVERLGFPVANEKCSPPSTNMVFSGKLFDTDSMTISIPEAKLKEIKQSINLIIKRKTITRPEDQWSYKRSPDICILFRHYFSNLRPQASCL